MIPVPWATFPVPDYGPPPWEHAGHNAHQYFSPGILPVNPPLSPLSLHEDDGEPCPYPIHHNHPSPVVPQSVPDPPANWGHSSPYWRHVPVVDFYKRADTPLSGSPPAYAPNLSWTPFHAGQAARTLSIKSGRSHHTGHWSTPPTTSTVFQSDALSAFNPASRPKDWRPQFSLHSKSMLHSFLKKICSAMPDWQNAHSVLAEINPLLRYRNTNLHPVGFDLRYAPCDYRLPPSGRPINPLDECQVATNPPSFPSLFLWHRKLPWVIEIIATSPHNGVTVGDIISQLFSKLQTPIRNKDFYNTEMKAKDREAIATAYFDRCHNNLLVVQQIAMVDFLGLNSWFMGLARSRNGMWEIKTRRRI